MFQQCIIAGHVATEPEMRTTSNGVPVCNFLVMTDGRNKEAKKTRFKVTCWRKLATIADQYLRKGRGVLVVGQIDTNAYLNRKTDEPDSILVLTADLLRFLSPGPGGANAEYAAEPGDNEEVPFMGQDEKAQPSDDGGIPF